MSVYYVFQNFFTVLHTKFAWREEEFGEKIRNEAVTFWYKPSKTFYTFIKKKKIPLEKKKKRKRER